MKVQVRKFVLFFAAGVKDVIETLAILVRQYFAAFWFHNLNRKMKFFNLKIISLVKHSELKVIFQKSLKFLFFSG